MSEPPLRREDGRGVENGGSVDGGPVVGAGEVGGGHHERPDERRFTRFALVALVLCGLAGATMAYRQMYVEYRRVTRLKSMPVLGRIPDASLVRENGIAFSLNQLGGMVWIADFIFTRCAGPCPMMSTRMTGLQYQLRDVSDVVLVSFSVDPEYDKPAVLRRYGEKFSADPKRWMFLTGDRDLIYDLSIKSFKLAVSQGEDYDRMIIHSTKFVLVDQSGQIRGYYDGLVESETARLVDDARFLAKSAGRR